MNQNTDVRMTKLDYASFVSDLGRFCTRSVELFDGWQLISQPEVHAVKQTTLNGCLRAEYHIIYSHSYQVPVMYFRVHDLKGQMMTDPSELVNSLMKSSPTCHLTSLSGSLLEGLTQMPHPYHQTPYFQIHPCKTSEWMANCPLTNSFVASWLSHVGPIVGITDMPSQYFTLVSMV